MKPLARITFDPKVMGGKPCIRGMRVTVGTIVGLVAAGHSFADILKAYPYLEEEDLREALAYAPGGWKKLSCPLPPREDPDRHEFVPRLGGGICHSGYRVGALVNYRRSKS